MATKIMKQENYYQTLFFFRKCVTSRYMSPVMFVSNGVSE